MAKSKRSNKDSKKGNKSGSAGKGQQHQRQHADAAAAAAASSSSSTRYFRLFPLDTTTVIEYTTNLTLLFVAALALGFSVGAGWINITAASWRWQVATAIRGSTAFQLATLQPGTWQAAMQKQQQQKAARIDFESHPSAAFAILREAVVREKGGYVHDDLGLLEPAPSGAARGLGMVRDSYTACQTRCFPGTERQGLQQAENNNNNNATQQPPPRSLHEEPLYKPHDVLIKVPLSFQMTRQVALDTLLTLVPAHVQKTANLHVLDDAALLTLLLAHERGVGRTSRWLPYIITLPHQPSCGYHRAIRPLILDQLEMLQYEFDVETAGWSTELLKAAQYASKIAESLARDYGAYLQTPPGLTPAQNLEWALCHVASRATAGSEKYGALRLVPLADMINHDATAGGFVEMRGDESLVKGDFVQSTGPHDAGAFVVRSFRNGRRRPLKVGQELMVNYNVPQYSPLDWLVSTGFVPPERWGKWHKVDRVWPPQRWNSVPDHAMPTAEQWSRDSPTIMPRLNEELGDSM